jgi:hypothetical protein
MSIVAFSLTVAAIGILGLVRTEIVFRVRMKRLGEISAKCKRDIGREDFYPLLEQRYAELERPSFESMVLDLRRWTYRQFYAAEVA